MRTKEEQKRRKDGVEKGRREMEITERRKTEEKKNRKL